MYTTSTTFPTPFDAQDADNLGPGIPRESQPLSPGDGSEENPFRRDAPFATSGKTHSREADAENPQEIQGGSVGGTPAETGSDGQGRVVYDGRSAAEHSGASPHTSFTLEWAPEANQELLQLEQTIANRIARKMRWFAVQETPLRFAKRLTGRYVGLWRFRVGDFRIICDLIDGRVRILRVLHVQNRRDAYRGEF